VPTVNVPLPVNFIDRYFAYIYKIIQSLRAFCLTAFSTAAAGQQSTDGGIGASSYGATDAVYTAQTSLGDSVDGVGYGANGVFTHTQYLVYGAV
jgi:hypothetical protein